MIKGEIKIINIKFKTPIKLYVDLSTRSVFDCSLESISPVLGILKSTISPFLNSINIILLKQINTIP